MSRRMLEKTLYIKQWSCPFIPLMNSRRYCMLQRFLHWLHLLQLLVYAVILKGTIAMNQLYLSYSVMWLFMKPFVSQSQKSSLCSCVLSSSSPNCTFKKLRGSLTSCHLSVSVAVSVCVFHLMCVCLCRLSAPHCNAALCAAGTPLKWSIVGVDRTRSASTNSISLW